MIRNFVIVIRKTVPIIKIDEIKSGEYRSYYEKNYGGRDKDISLATGNGS